jgi:hypothetical protein
MGISQIFHTSMVLILGPFQNFHTSMVLILDLTDTCTYILAILCFFGYYKLFHFMLFVTIVNYFGLF